MWTLSALLLSVAAPEPETFALESRRVASADRFEVACAQVGLEPYVPLDDGSSFQRTELPHPDGAVPLLLDPRVLSDPGSRDVLWVDADRDAEEDEGELLVLERRDESNPFVRASLQALGLPFELLVYENGGQQRTTVTTLYHHEAEVVLDGVVHEVVFVDMDLDDAVSAGDQWLVLDPAQSASLSPPSRMFASNLTSEPWYVGPETLLRVELEGGLRLVREPAAQPRHAFLAQRAARVNAKTLAQYDEDRAAFLAQFDIDPDRPVDPDPPTWHYAWDLEEALAVAAREGRPLWVEFTSDGCPWCKRYPWLNDKDAAVTPHLRRFTLVRIDRDLDPNQTARSLGLEGVPCHALFDAQGEALFTSEGWMAPDGQVEVLERAWATLAD